MVRSGEGISRMRKRYAGSQMPDAFDKTVHPTQPMYDEIGILVLETLDRDRMLDD
jgi:hypothetical protein